MEYFFLLQNNYFYRKPHKKKFENTHTKIKLINFRKGYEWLHNGAHVKTSKIWAPVCWKPVLLELSPVGDGKRSTRTTIQWSFKKIEDRQFYIGYTWQILPLICYNAWQILYRAIQQGFYFWITI